MSITTHHRERWLEATAERVRPGATLAGALATATACVILLPLFDSGAWLAPTLAAIAIMALTGALARAIRLPIPLQPILQVAALVCLLTLYFARKVAVAGFIPGPVAIDQLRDLARAGLIQADIVLAPVPTIPMLVLLAVGGVGLVAMVVDVVGVSLRLPAAAGIPLLLMYALPVAVIPNGVAWWLLPIAISGWLVLLYVDSRSDITSWGRLLTVRVRPGGTAAHARAGAGGTALSIALVASLLAITCAAVVPGLNEPVWVSKPATEGTAAPDDGPVTVDPFVSLRRSLLTNSDQQLLTYTTDAPRPSYLRLVTLEQFEGDTWSERPPSVRIAATEELPAPPAPAVTDVQDSTYHIDVGDLDNAQLPLPYAATSLSGLGASRDAWSWDPGTRTIAGPGASSQNMDYVVHATAVTPTKEELRAATKAPSGETALLTQLPDDISPLLLSTAQEVTAGADTPYAKAMALVQWFTQDGGFVYSTSVTTPPDADPLESFLTERIGYCQQFASTMALMARAVGIPSRVSVGFTAGRKADGAWQVRARNAHAWPELWFSGIGWVWFEPTPRTEAGAGVVSPSYAEPRTPIARDPAESSAEPRTPKADAGSSAPSSSSTTATSWWSWLPLAALVLTVLLVPIVGVRWRRRIRTARADPRLRVEGAWREVGDTARDLDWPWRTSATPRQAGAELHRAAELPDDARRALTRLVWWVEKVRYAPEFSDTAVPSTAELRADLALIRQALRRRVPRKRVWKSVLLPGSLFGGNGASAAEAPDRVSANA